MANFGIGMRPGISKAKAPSFYEILEKTLQFRKTQISVTGSINLFAENQAPIRIDFISAEGNYSAYVKPVSIVSTEISHCNPPAVRTGSVISRQQDFSKS
jgi:hypothetical protein